MKLPDFLIKKVPKLKNIRRIRSLIEDPTIHTVCESARCPNIGECFSQNTLTFMILGDICTRNCGFCGVKSGQPLPPDPTEPHKIALIVKKLKLNYVVITSVTRDDLPDGGASHFAAIIRELLPLRVEVLIPDFQGIEASVKTALEAKPFVLNHNIETVPRFYPQIRPQADYQRSLKVLEIAKKQGICTKSGFMLGFGESQEEIITVLEDLKEISCDIVTIGQYLPPTKVSPKAARYIPPEEFKEYEQIGVKLGLKVVAGPFVRSSYKAKDIVSC